MMPAAITSHNHGNCELCDAIEANSAAVLDKLRALLEQWRLEGLREREDFPDEARKLARCSHQLQPIVEHWDVVMGDYMVSFRRSKSYRHK